MTINEAILAKHTKLRLPIWNPTAYIEIKYVNGFAAPWAKIFDLGEECDRPYLILTDECKDWEPFHESTAEVKS